MIEFFQLLLNREIFTRKIPLWHILILLGMCYAGWKLDGVDVGVLSANATLQEHGKHLDRIDDALYYGLNIDTTQGHPAGTGTPRMRTGSFNSTNNINLVKIP